jgi:glutaminase
MENLTNYLEELVKKYRPLKEGHLADYIPELSKVSPDLFSLAVVTVDGQIFSAGDDQYQFSLQSTSKPFLYAMALQEHSREFLLSKVGVEPTGEAFNSIVELEKHTHRPYNPMINSGAIAVSSFIKDTASAKRLDRVLEMFSNLAGRKVGIDDKIFNSEKQTAHRNRSIAHLLRHFEIVGDDIEESLDLYFQQCSVMVNTVDLAMMGATLASGGIQPKTKKKVMNSDTVPDVLSLMFTCGMYDTAGEWAYNVGLPAKSGVSGALFTVVPGKLCLAAYSPLINHHGHSLRSVAAVKDFVRQFQLNMFLPKI